jgi:glycosyltransferase involved in cell wall biosynthesis
VTGREDQRGRVSVLHLITTLDVGGAEMMLLKLLSRMNADTFENHVISLAEEGRVGQRISSYGIPVHFLNMPRGRVTIKGLMKLYKLMRKIRPQILQTWMYHADLIGLLVGKWLRVTRICWNIRCSNIDYARYRPATLMTFKLCAKLASFPDVIIANSKAGEGYHKRMGYRGKRWELIPSGFDLAVFKPDGQAKENLAQELGLHQKEALTFIGHIARFDPMKDHPTFLTAASQLLRERRDVYFVLAGRNVDRNNREILENIPEELKGHFHLLGERDDAEKITAALDIACSVSYGEGFSNVIGEAMACGVPCVVTDVGDSAFIVGDTGLVVRPRDSGALLDAWKTLLDLGSARRAELGRAARKRIEDCFDIEKIVERYEALYTSLMDDRGGCCRTSQAGRELRER